jgi:hypothetical protein
MQFPTNQINMKLSMIPFIIFSWQNIILNEVIHSFKIVFLFYCLISSFDA